MNVPQLYLFDFRIPTEDSETFCLSIIDLFKIWAILFDLPDLFFGVHLFLKTYFMGILPHQYSSIFLQRKLRK